MSRRWVPAASASAPYLGVHECIDIVFIHHFEQRQPGDVTSGQAIALAFLGMALQVGPVHGAGARRLVVELGVLDPVLPDRAGP